MKVQPYTGLLVRRMMWRHQESNGDVPVATCQKTPPRLHILVGVRKSWTPSRSTVYHHIHAGKPVAVSGPSQNHVHIPVICCAMPVHVHPAQQWVHLKAAFVASKKREDDALKRTTKQVGAVALSAETPCLVGSIHVKGRVMRVFAVLVPWRWMPGVIVARSRRKSNATIGRKRKKVWIGRDASTVVKCARDLWTVGYTAAGNIAIPKTLPRRIVHGLWMSSSTVLAARLLWLISTLSLGRHAPTLFPPARNNADDCYPADMNAGKPVILGSASLVPCKSPPLVDVVVTHLRLFATKPHRIPLSVPASAKLL